MLTLKHAARNFQLLHYLLVRDLFAKYSGSVLGALWAFATPVLMLAIYTFVFGVIFKSRWGDVSLTTGAYALNMYVGLMIYSIFSESVLRSSTVITSHPNYVKKVVFPLDILPVMLVGSALFQSVVGMVVWVSFFIVISGAPPMTIALYPVVLMPLVAISLGLALCFSALGVYVRDLSQVLGALVPSIMFLSPIFYPRSALPVWAQDVLLFINPVAIPIEQARLVLIEGSPPDLLAICAYAFVSLLILSLGSWVFDRARRGFADVL